MPYVGDSVAASTRRVWNAGGPPCTRYSLRMSGVLAKKFGRQYSCIPEWASSSMYSVSSWRPFFQVKYVYDWLKPALASARSLTRRVNASDRKITSGYSARTSSISHSQNGSGLVCGLSTRKTRTPRSTQVISTSLSASHNPRQSSESQLTLKMSWYRFGGFSAYLRVPSGRRLNQSGCSLSQGWSAEHWIAKSSAISRPCSRASATRRSNSATVPSSGWMASWPPSSPPIAQGEPGSPDLASSELLRPLRLVTPIGWIGGREI